jgi:hypothetical protein
VTDNPYSDLIALRQLSEQYALAADRRDGAGYAEVFTPDGRLLICHGDDPEPVITVQGAEELAAVPDRFLSQYQATMHFVGNHTATIDGGAATGTTYCEAHHVSDGQDETMMIWYHDTYQRTVVGWRIAERRLVLRWTQPRPVRLAGH